MNLSPPKKRVSKHLSVLDKEGIVNVFKTFEQNQPGGSKTDHVELTATAAGVCKSSVFNVLHEYNTNHSLQAPKQYHRLRPILDTVTEGTKSALRRLVHSFFLRNEPPTVKKIMSCISEDENLPTFKQTTLNTLLKEIGFRYGKRSRNSMLCEKNEIVVWRRQFLRQIRKFRNDGKKIYYLDETWVNAGHVTPTVWMDTTVETARQAFIYGLSTGLKSPSGKGKRLIVLHIGSDEGFVENGLLIFESKGTGDYHQEMNADVFENWLQAILPTLEEGSVIVLDNAPYHSRKLEKNPTSASKKADIQAWLRNKSIDFEEDMLKAELLQLVKENISKPKYAVDEMTKASNRIVLRLPPYHCELNPIELIWGQIKGEVGRKNTTFKLQDVKNLFFEAVGNVTSENWKKCVQHVIKVEQDMWQMDVALETVVEPLIISLGSDESSTSGSEESS